MKFLHTSDWHLGRTLHGLGLQDAQRDFVSELERITIESGVDCVVIAGDVFDRAVPPVESVALFTDALRRISARATVIAIAGNHDSAIRLGYGSPLYRDGIHVVTDAERAGGAIPVTSGAETVLFYPIPYLDPDHARTVLSGPGEPLPRSHEAVMVAAMGRIRSDRAARVANGGEDWPAVVIAHAFVVGGEPTDSERDIRVGGVDSVPAGVFAGIDYVALGHLHGPQQISAGAGDAVIRYAGSPLRYSFSEVHQTKSVTIVDVALSGACEVTLVPLAQPRAMAVLVGELTDILSQTHRTHAQDWVRVVVTDSARPAQLHERIREAFPHAISVTHQPSVAEPVLATGLTALTSADPVAVSTQFVKDVTSAAATEDEVAVLREACEAVLAGNEDVLGGYDGVLTGVDR